MMMSFTLHPREMSQVPGCDPAFMETINKNMCVPERLSVGRGQQWLEDDEEQSIEPPPAYTMQVPDRLTYTGWCLVFLNLCSKSEQCMETVGGSEVK